MLVQSPAEFLRRRLQVRMAPQVPSRCVPPMELMQAAGVALENERGVDPALDVCQAVRLPIAKRILRQPVIPNRAEKKLFGFEGLQTFFIETYQTDRLRRLEDCNLMARWPQARWVAPTVLYPKRTLQRSLPRRTCQTR